MHRRIGEKAEKYIFHVMHFPSLRHLKNNASGCQMLSCFPVFLCNSPAVTPLNSFPLFRSSSPIHEMLLHKHSLPQSCCMCVHVFLLDWKNFPDSLLSESTRSPPAPAAHCSLHHDHWLSRRHFRRSLVLPAARNRLTTRSRNWKGSSAEEEERSSLPADQTEGTWFTCRKQIL